MKKSTIFALIAATLIFAAFVAGFYIGRNTAAGEINISIVGTTAPTGSTETSRVNINTATVEELMTLPGIGRELAQRIVDYRVLHGKFHSTADIILVDGIGEKTLQNLLPYITIGG